MTLRRKRAPRTSKVAAAAGLLACAALALPAGQAARAQIEPVEGPHMPSISREGYPLAILERLKRERGRRIVTSKRMNAPWALIVPIARRWQPGQTVTVAFSRGTRALHRRIESAVRTWTQRNIGANLQFSFRNANGNFRSWNRDDLTYAADIRIDFSDEEENRGFWSMVGSDSINPRLVGAGEASMNLESFDRNLPRDWRTTVLHEFGHALGFEHEHQSPLAQCGFRFYDDAGYVPTQNADGMFVADSAGRRPGLYTRLGGPPWHWERREVDFNLETLMISDEHLSSDRFDNDSIMRYWFDADYFEAGRLSPCWSEWENEEPSPLDLSSAQTVYPWDPDRQLIRSRQLISQLFRTLPEDSSLTTAVRDALKTELRDR